VPVAVIFLASGLALPSERLRAAAGDWRVHAFIQGFSLLLVPALALALDAPLAALGVPEPARLGLAFLACLPTTITSGVVFTRSAGGDEALALVNAVLGNLLGLVATPLALLLVVGRGADIPLLPVLRELGLLVLLPFAVGQVLRLRLAPWTQAHRALLSNTPQVMVAVVLWLVFSDALTHGSGLAAAGVAGLVLLIAGVHALLLLLAWIGTARLDRPRRIAATIVATQKTAALGAPLLAIVFGGRADAAAIALPLIIYHPLQLLVAGALAARWRRTTA
jgi:sodium/bile acid cotransporter 7